MKLVYLCLALTLAPPCFAAQPQCLKLVDNSKSSPIPLNGKLSLSYWEDEIDWNKADMHELGVLDFDHPGEGIMRLTTNKVNESEMDVSLDGSRMLYTVRPRLDDFDHPGEIWVRNTDGSGAFRLLTGKKFGGSVWDPDGKGFSYIVISEKGVLYHYDFATKQSSTYAIQFPKNLVKGPEDPEISHDGKTLMFKLVVKGDADDAPSIYVVGRDGNGMRRLTEGFSDHDPVFSRDNKKFYFERFYGGKASGNWFDCSQERSLKTPECQWWGIVEVDVASKAERVLMPHDPCGRHFFWLPTVSPDGKSIMVTHHEIREKNDDDGAKSDLWVFDADGGRPQKVPGSESIYFFDWSR